MEDIFWHDYQTKARSTAIYPRQGKNPLYPMLGLIGEIGEIANKVKKIMRDDNDQITPKRRQEIGDEIGDALWYIANLCYELHINMDTFAIKNSLKPECINLFYEILYVQLPIYKIGATIQSLHPEKPYFETHKKLKSNIGLILQFLLSVSIILDLDLREIATNNIEKLFDRKDRGVLGGSGDER